MATQVAEAARGDERQVCRCQARERDVRFSAISAADQQRFDRLYLEDAERNARALERFGIDGIATFRLARASVPAHDSVVCRSPA